MYISEDCVKLKCQCCRCASNRAECCIHHEGMTCPDDTRKFYPGYVCPDFAPREEDQNNAPD